MITVADLLKDQRIGGNYFAFDAYIKGDFEAGLLENRRGDRLLALPETLIQAIYTGLERETGQAYGVVLVNCGRWWGKNFYAKNGMESLSPLSRREKRTLEVITTAHSNSRLACQALVLNEGVIVELPNGMYVNAIEDIEALIGRRANRDILHPLNGKVLVEAGKLVTRSMITQLKDTRTAVGEYLSRTSDA